MSSSHYACSFLLHFFSHGVRSKGKELGLLKEESHTLLWQLKEVS